MAINANGKFTFFFLILWVVAVFLISCNPKHSNPEELDPIYQDLKVQLGLAHKDLANKEEDIEDIIAQMNNAEPQTGEIRKHKIDIWEKRKQIEEIKQKIRFLELKIRSRVQHDRKTYEKAYAEGKGWPNPREYEKYKLQKQFENSSRNWNDRVPKLRNRVKAYKEAREAEEQKKREELGH